MRRRIAFALLAAGAAAACSLGLDGFSGGPDASDAGGDASSSTPTPPPGTPPPGTPPPQPGGGDGGDAGVDPCAGTIFCDTFDVGALGAQWDPVHNYDAGSIALDTAASISPPNAVLATVPSGLTGASHYLTKRLLAPTTSDLDIELDLRLEAACEGHVVEIGVDGTGTVEYLFHLELDSGGSTVTLSQTNEQADGGLTQTDLANGVPTLPIGTWAHIRLRANVGAKSGEYYVNGVLVRNVTLAPIVTAGTPHFRAGVVSEDNGVGCTVRIDDVAVRAR